MHTDVRFNSIFAQLTPACRSTSAAPDDTGPRARRGGLGLLALIASICLLAGSGCGGGGSSDASAVVPVVVTPVVPVPVAVAPTITTQPASQTAVVGAAASFSVVASGDTPLSYQWQRNGVDVAQATGASYTLPATQLADDGSTWGVVVRNAAGSVSSMPASLSLTPAGKLPLGISLLAGSVGGAGNLDGIGAAARFSNPRGVAVDAHANVYVADTENQTIRKITPAGVVSTLAGSAGTIGSADGIGAAASFHDPEGLAVDSTGNVYVADTSNHTIRKINAAGMVSTLAGTAGTTGSADGIGTAARFYSPRGLAVDAAGNVYIADSFNNTIRKITPAGLVSTLAGSASELGATDGTGAAARFNSPYGVAVDVAANVYVTDKANHTIRRITPTGVVSTLAGAAMVQGSADGAGAAARFVWPSGLAVDAAGDVYVADAGNNTIRKVTAAGVVSTVAGTAEAPGAADGFGGLASFSSLEGLAIDAAGNVYVAEDRNHKIRKIAPDRTVSTFAGSAGSDGSADGNGAAAQFYLPKGLGVDTTGKVYVADTNNHTIRKISLVGTVSTLAGTAGVAGFANGAGATARFVSPAALTVDSDGNVYVADSAWDSPVRKITPAGVVSTPTGIVDEPGGGRGVRTIGLAVDASGNVYVADEVWSPGLLFTAPYVERSRIHKITPNNVISTVFVLEGETSPWAHISCIAVDRGGNVYAADQFTLRKITPAGVVTLLAGTAGAVGSADGIGAAASFNGPSGLAVDAVGNVYVADTGNHTIRKITPAGVVSTVVGKAGVSGIVLGALPGGLRSPRGLALDAKGVLYITSGGAVLRVQLSPV